MSVVAWGQAKDRLPTDRIMSDPCRPFRKTARSCPYCRKPLCWKPGTLNPMGRRYRWFRSATRCSRRYPHKSRLPRCRRDRFAVLWCRISAHWLLSALSSRIRETASWESSLGWWKGRDDRVGMTTRPYLPYSACFCSHLTTVEWSYPKWRATFLVLHPSSLARRTACMRTSGRWGFVVYAMYIL